MVKEQITAEDGKAASRTNGGHHAPDVFSPYNRKEREERPAGTRAQQGKRDHHEGEMVEMRDGEQACEGDFKKKGGTG